MVLSGPRLKYVHLMHILQLFICQRMILLNMYNISWIIYTSGVLTVYLDKLLECSWVRIAAQIEPICFFLLMSINIFLTGNGQYTKLTFIAPYIDDLLAFNDKGYFNRVVKDIYYLP